MVLRLSLSLRRIAVASTVSILLQSCGGAQPRPNPNDDPLVIALALARSSAGNSPLTGAAAVAGIVSRVEVTHRTSVNDPATETVVVALENALPFSVTFPGSQIAIPIAALEVPTGFVSRVRFWFEQLSVVTKDGTTHNVDVPGGVLTIAPPSPLAVFAGTQTSLRVDIDPQKDLRCWSELGGYAIYSTERTETRDRSTANGVIGSDGVVQVGANSVINGDIQAARSVTAAVDLRSGAQVSGSVVTAGTVQMQAGAVVSGKLLQGVAVPAVAVPTRVVTPGAQDVNVFSGTHVLAPGRYGSVHVFPGSTLALSSGAYELRSLAVEADATLDVRTDGAEPISVATSEELRFGERLAVRFTGEPSLVTWYTDSSNPVTIARPRDRFQGILTAPRADVVIASGTTLDGAVHARRVTIETESVVNWHPQACEAGLVLSPWLVGRPVAALDVTAGVLQDTVSVQFSPTTSRGQVESYVRGLQGAEVVRWSPTNYVTVSLPPDVLLSDAVRRYEELGPSIVSFARPAQLQWFADTVTLPDDADETYHLTMVYGARAFTAGTFLPVVAVIDKGVDLAFRDLWQNIWINEGELPETLRPSSPGTGADFDGDGVVSFWDLNHPSAAGAELLASLQIVDRPGDGVEGVIDAYDLLAAVRNNTDDDANGYADDLFGWNFVEDRPDPQPLAKGDDSHGLAVAGIVGAIEGNGYGTSGVSPKVRLAVFRIGSGAQAFESWRGEHAVKYAAAKGMDVLNLSWGALHFSTNLSDSELRGAMPDQNEPVSDCKSLSSGGAAESPGTYKELMRKDEQFWQSPDLAHVLIVRAAGNCGLQVRSDMRNRVRWDGIGIPNVNNIIVVTGYARPQPPYLGDTTPSAIGQGMVMGSDVVDIAAPRYATVLGYSDIGHDTPSVQVGTSFSTPYVSGAAALVLSHAYDELRNDPAALRARILDNADKAVMPGDLVRDGNRLNVCRAVANGACPTARPSAPSRPDAGIPSWDAGTNPCAGFPCDSGEAIVGSDGQCFCPMPIP